MRRIFTTLVFSLLTVTAMTAQGWPSGWQGVMLQGFYWDSYDDTRWTKLEAQADELSRYFSLIWVPQSGWCGSTMSMGYNDCWWYDQRSAFGSEAELRSMIAAYRQRGTGIMADVVINHRNGATRWADFPTEVNPYDGQTYSMGLADICNTDEYNTDGGAAGERAQYGMATGAADTGDDFNGCRDLDHTSANVQANCKAYTAYLLNYLGYAGFRYDMVKGFAAKYVGMYNAASKPSYSVGEYWDGNKQTVVSWINGTQTDGAVQSAAFDFPQKYLMTNNPAKYGNWYSASGALATDNTYKRYGVTFVDNHDTYRDNNKFTGDIPAANAWILAIPGTPCVFLPHWQTYKAEIAAMIKVRKAVGVSNTSDITVSRNPADYVIAEVSGADGRKLVAVIGDVSQASSFVANSYPDCPKVLGGTHYAYYAKGIKGIFTVDKSSGSYDNSVDVTINALGGAEIVYTTDGSEPTLANGTRTAEAATVLHLTATTTLKVGLVDGQAVTGVETYVYTVNAFRPYDITVYVNTDNVGWNGVNFWTWGGDGSHAPHNTSWPGDRVTGVTAVDGKNWYSRTYTINSSADCVSFVFSTGSGSPQTVDVEDVRTDKFFEVSTATEGGKHKVDDVTGQHTTGVGSAVAGDADCSSPVRVYTVDGRMVRSCGAGTDAVDAVKGLDKGLYIVNGKKIVIR